MVAEADRVSDGECSTMDVDYKLPVDCSLTCWYFNRAVIKERAGLSSAYPST